MGYAVWAAPPEQHCNAMANQTPPKETRALVVAEVVDVDTYAVPARAERLFALAVGKLSENTRKAYASDLRRFAWWWDKPDGASALWDLTKLKAGEAREVVLEYQAALIQRGLSKNTVARAIRALNSIVKKLHFAEKVPWELGVPVDKTEAYKDVRGPDPEDWTTLLDETEAGEDWIDYRDAAMFRLLGECGLRASEVCAIDYPHHLRTKKREIYIQGKGDKNLWFPIGPLPWGAIEDWIKVRGDAPGPLFTSKRGSRINRYLVYDRVTARAQAAGLDHIHPHALRHRAITSAAGVVGEEGMPQSSLTDFARHSDARTTDIYVDRLKENTRKIADLVGSQRSTQKEVD